MSLYTDADRERFLPEGRASSSKRSEFARDRARVVHSSALRRLGAKTQVLSPGEESDFARTRLTHSLEVAQVGREMALDLGVDPEIVDMACLAHDLGHPPFGHNGERALNEWSADFGGFEGNAQTLRILTRIEPKVFTVDGRSLGLNLTRAGLDATCKYPWALEQAKLDDVTFTNKFGVYADDLEIFEWMRLRAPTERKSIEAQIMDFADDVAYSVHDFEDAIVSGYLDLSQVAASLGKNWIVDEIQRWAHHRFDLQQIEAALDRIRASKNWISVFESTQAQLASLKNLTSELIGSFVRRTTDATVAQADGASIVRFAGELHVPTEVQAEIAVLKGLVSAFLMSLESRQEFYAQQRVLLTELADAILADAPANLDPFALIAWQSAKTEEQRLRIVTDQVANLTDQSALKLHERLVVSRRAKQL